MKQASIQYKEVLKRFREERNRVGLEQEEIAMFIGISQSNYSKFESGINRLNYFQLQRLCESNIEVNYAYTGIKGKYGSTTETESYEQLLQTLMLIADLVKYIYKYNEVKELEHLNFELNYVNLMESDSKHPFSIIKRIREYNNLTQEKMAEDLGIDIKKYRKLEKGQNDPDSELLLLLYNMYGIAPCIILKNNVILSNYIEYILSEIKLIDRKRIHLPQKILSINNLLSE